MSAANAIRHAFPVEVATGPRFQTRTERDRAARLRALRPYVEALRPAGSTSIEIAATLWSRTDRGSCAMAASALTVARRHGLVARAYTRGGVAVWTRTEAAEAWLAGGAA